MDTIIICTGSLVSIQFDILIVLYKYSDCTYC
jgi:hypothetical protein